MRKKYAYIAHVAVLAAVAIVGALMTPSPVAAMNPYVVGGEVEVPPQSTGPDVGLIVGAVAAAALAVGVFVAYKLGK